MSLTDFGIKSRESKYGGNAMNRMLASILNMINIIYAILIIFGFIYAGSYLGGQNNEHHFVITILGGIIGFLVAGALCGLISLLTLIEGHLRAIREHGNSNDGNDVSDRFEPTFKIKVDPKILDR